MASKGKEVGTSNTNKRSRKNSNPQPSLDPILNNLGIEFRNPNEVSRFTNLRSKRMRPTQFPDIPALKTLGIHSNVKTLHGVMGSVGFLSLHEKTYEALTYEFLCTLRKEFSTEYCGTTGNPYQMIHIHFRLLGQEYSLNSLEINRILGWPFFTNYETQCAEEYNESDFWRQITGIPVYKSRSAKASSIIHPTLRLIHRIYACTIFAREDKGTVNKKELYLLWAFVKKHEKVVLSHWLIETFSDMISPTFNGEIHVGGIITLFARHLRVNIPREGELNGSTKLDISTLKIMQMISERENGKYAWLCGPEKTPYIILSNENLPLARYNQPTTWIFPNALNHIPIQEVQDEQGEEEQALPNPNPNQFQFPPEVQHQFTQMFNQNNQLYQEWNQFRGEFQEVRGRVNTIYDYAAEHWPGFPPPPPPFQ